MREPLEAVIVENPDDISGYLVYADWLEEQSNPRGEFIRVQLALEDENIQGAERKKLLTREKELLAKHCRDWLGELADFIVPVGKKKSSDFRNAIFSFTRGWLATLTLEELSVSLAHRLARAPEARLLRRLEINYSEFVNKKSVIDGVTYDRMTTPGVGPLASSTNFRNLRYLRLGNDSGTFGEHVSALVRNLPRLEVFHCNGTDTDIEEVLACPFPCLRELEVHNLDSYPLEILAKNSTVTQLTSLSLHPRGVSDEEEEAYLGLNQLRGIARSPNLHSLTRLTFRLSDSGDEGVQEIISSGLLSRLRLLDLQYGAVTDSGAELLAAEPALKQLEHLDLTGNALTKRGIKRLRDTGILVTATEQHDPDDRTFLYEGTWE